MDPKNRLESTMLATLWGDRVDVNWKEIPAEAEVKIEILTNLVFTFVSALVDDEKSIRITVRGNHRRAMFTVRVADDDVAFAVGSGGRHADALRTIMIAACRKLRFHMDIDIIGPSGKVDWSSS